MGKPATLTTEEMDLRRRARRRLVGAVALALLAVVVLPMLFNPEPKPMGSDVDIHIPDQASPFEPNLPTTTAPGHQDAGPRPPLVTPPPADEVPPAAQAALAAPSGKTIEMAAPTPAAPLAPHAKATPRKLLEVQPPQATKPAAAKTDAQSRPAAPVPETIAPRGYILQLGAFSSEANARQVADKARAAGFQAKVESAAGQVRVRVGPYAERERALEVQAKLRAKGFSPILLGP